MDNFIGKMVCIYSTNILVVYGLINNKSVYRGFLILSGSGDPSQVFVRGALEFEWLDVEWGLVASALSRRSCRFWYEAYHVLLVFFP